MKKVTVIGSGSWGTALAVMLAKNGHEVVIWSRRQDAVDELLNDRKNERYLPGVVIPENIQATTDREAAVAEAEIIRHHSRISLSRMSREVSQVSVESMLSELRECLSGMCLSRMSRLTRPLTRSI